MTRQPDKTCRAAIAGLLLLPALIVAAGPARASAVEPAPQSSAADSSASRVAGVEMRRVPADAREVYLVRDDGGYEYVVTWTTGRQETLTPDAYARLLYDDYASRRWLYTILNITSPLGMTWVGLGLLGQVLFTGRMVVQWLTSEKHKRSVVPTAFWWMSLGGASMLIVYFIWRRDAVGILGQATGWAIYVRNLVLIYSPGRRPAEVTADPAPEAELGG